MKTNKPLPTGICVIIQSLPFSSINGKEGVDLALVCAAFDLPVNLIFVSVGVLHLIGAQQESFFDDKYHDKQLKGLEFYDIEQLLVLDQSLSDYSITANDLVENAQIIDQHAINQLCANSQHTVIF